MIALREKKGGNYSRILYLRELSADALVRARRIFADYKKRGVLLNNDFEDDIWRISDEKRTTSLMKFSLCDQEMPPWVNCSANEYRDCVKIYIAFNLGELAPFTLQELSRELLKLPALDAMQAVASEKCSKYIPDFLQLLPGGSAERDGVIEQFSERQSKSWGSDGKMQQRILADFKSYLRFNDVLAEFWQSASAGEKLFYFPLYLWWNLTAILPLRVTEFLLTPRNCLEGQNGCHSITVRRGKLKGGGRKIAYRIADDYELYKYEITDALAYEIRAYIETTKDMTPTQLDTLFLIEPHYKCLSVTPGHLCRYYTYQNLDTCIRSFFKEVIVPGGAEISAIKLGDTRHLAMVNLIISGGSPVICRELAGHADIGISSHYYTNISNLVKCVTIERLRKSRGGDDAVATGGQRYWLSTAGLQRVTGGFCGSSAFASRGISDCLKSIGPDGQIGECTVCPHFRPDRQGLNFEFGSNYDAKSAVDADSHYLMQTVEIVRKGLGYQEDIGTALLRLQHSANRYSMSIQERCYNGKT